MEKIIHYLKTHRTTEITLLVLISLIAASNWLNFELPKGHDAVGSICSVAGIKQFLLSFDTTFHWPAYGDLGGFYLGPPLFGYLLIILSYLFTWIVAGKLLFFLIFALSGVFAYYYIYELTKSRLASFVGGLTYIFVPYYLIEVVFEGHWDIGLAYMLAPLLFLATEKAVQHPKATRIALAGGLLALLILTFPQSFPILIGPFLGLYMLFRIWLMGKQRFSTTITCLLIFSIGLLLTAFWWLPLLWEIDYLHTSYPLEDAEWFQATFLQAITLRHGMSCSPSSAYGASGPILRDILQLLPLVLALLGIILNRKNKYIWFFSASFLLTVFLAMGPDSPVNIYEVAHQHMPFFSYLRTPVRFLLFANFAYAVLIGFCVKGITERFKHVHLRKLKYFNIPLVVVALASLIIISNTWQECRAAFSTFSLTPDQQDALDWLEDQENGDYYIANPPFEYYIYSSETRYMANPIDWIFLHGKETILGHLPTSGNTYTESIRNSLYWNLQEGKTNIGEWLNILNVKYVILDKTDPVYSNIVLGEGFKSVWTSNTIDIYENIDMVPRMSSLSATQENIIDLYDENVINLSWDGGTGDATLSLDSQHTLSQDFSIKSSYNLPNPDNDWVFLKVDIEDIDFDQDDAIHLTFYSEDNLPDIQLVLDLFEQDGSQYNIVLDAVDGIKSGWNEVFFPIDLFKLRFLTDENDHLDFDEIDKFWIGVLEGESNNEARQFELYFNKLSVVSYERNTDIDYTKISEGKYTVHVGFDSPSYLVLAEPYRPNWVAKYDDEEVSSQLVYEGLNGFYLEAGEYEVTLEFIGSSWRNAGNFISATSAIIIGAVIVYLWIREKKRWNQDTSDCEGSKRR